MDYDRENVVHVIPTNGSENWFPNSSDSSVWATEDDYRFWNNRESSVDTPPSNSNYDPQSRSGSEQPPTKKSRSSQDSTSRSKAIGKMFFKTKLCCKFRQGTCPYVTNCNFAHSIEELRRPPPNWQDIVAAHEEERSGSSFSEQREEYQIPILGSSPAGGETRSSKGRHCKKFYTEEGCPYGDSCTFLHDEASKNRESVAISLGPGGYGGGGGGNGGGGSAAGGAVGGGNGSASKPSNWKTRICNKWEITGYCPFGNKCHFAHGSEELHRYGGGFMEGEGRNTTTTASDSKQGVMPSKSPAENAAAPSPSVPHSDVLHMGVGSQRASILIQRPVQAPRTLQKWKGPDKISRIYGDWIDDVE